MQVVFSSLYEVVIDFTKNYSLIRAALSKLDHYDKTQIHNLLMACSNILTSNWGSQSYAQILMVTDCGTGLGAKSLKNLIISETAGLSPEASPIMSLPPQSKFSIIVSCCRFHKFCNFNILYFSVWVIPTTMASSMVSQKRIQ